MIRLLKRNDKKETANARTAILLNEINETEKAVSGIDYHISGVRKTR